MTTLEAAMANTEAAVKGQVDQFNAQRVATYRTDFSNWSISVQAGRVDNTHPPAVPTAMIVGHFTDPTNEKASWAYPAEGTAPVCDALPIPPAVKPYTPPALPESEHIRNVPPGDTMPMGYIATAPDGARWQKQQSPTPWGLAVFYVRLS